MANFSIHSTHSTLFDCLAKIRLLEQKLEDLSPTNPTSTDTVRIKRLEKQIAELDKADVLRASEHKEVTTRLTKVVQDIDKIKSKLTFSTKIAHESLNTNNDQDDRYLNQVPE